MADLLADPWYAIIGIVVVGILVAYPRLSAIYERIKKDAKDEAVQETTLKSLVDSLADYRKEWTIWQEQHRNVHDGIGKAIGEVTNKLNVMDARLKTLEDQHKTSDEDRNEIKNLLKLLVDKDK